MSVHRLLRWLESPIIPLPTRLSWSLLTPQSKTPPQSQDITPALKHAPAAIGIPTETRNPAAIQTATSKTPYEEAMAKVQAISKRMQEIGSANVTHPDPAIQRQLRGEYYRLEQDMEKYNTALMLTDEYAAEEARKEREWEDENYDENVKALKAIRRMMPVDVKKMSEADLQTMKSPTGKTLPRDAARKFKRTNVLELIRMDPADIAKCHPSLLENLRTAGLNVTERRALHMHLRGVAETWKAEQGDKMTKKKFEWFKTLEEKFKTVVNCYNRAMKQCPAYDQDLGYPDGDVYMESTVQKGSPYDAGARALAEVQELARAANSEQMH